MKKSEKSRKKWRFVRQNSKMWHFRRFAMFSSGPGLLLLAKALRSAENLMRPVFDFGIALGEPIVGHEFEPDGTPMPQEYPIGPHECYFRPGQRSVIHDEPHFGPLAVLAQTLMRERGNDG